MGSYLLYGGINMRPIKLGEFIIPGPNLPPPPLPPPPLERKLSDEEEAEKAKSRLYLMRMEYVCRGEPLPFWLSENKKKSEPSLENYCTDYTANLLASQRYSSSSRSSSTRSSTSSASSSKTKRKPREEWEKHGIWGLLWMFNPAGVPEDD